MREAPVTLDDYIATLPDDERDIIERLTATDDPAEMDAILADWQLAHREAAGDA